MKNKIKHMSESLQDSDRLVKIYQERDKKYQTEYVKKLDLLDAEDQLDAEKRRTDNLSGRVVQAEEELSKMNSVKAAFQSDKQVLMGEIENMKSNIKLLQQKVEAGEVNKSKLEQQINHYKYEINILNGKFIAVKRELDHITENQKVSSDQAK